MNGLPLAPRTGQAAIDYAMSRVGPDAMPDSGYCLAFTRECFAVPAVYGSAGDAGRACHTPHAGDRHPPAGVPVWFWTSSPYDHVCLFVSETEIVTTFNADVRVLRGISDVEAQFQGQYAGFGFDLNEYQVYVPATTPPPDDGEDDDMRPMFIRSKAGEVVMSAGEGVVGLTLDHWQVWQNLGYKITHDEMDPGPFEAVIADLGGRR